MRTVTVTRVELDLGGLRRLRHLSKVLERKSVGIFFAFCLSFNSCRAMLPAGHPSSDLRSESHSKAMQPNHPICHRNDQAIHEESFWFNTAADGNPVAHTFEFSFSIHGRIGKFM